jgi:hypothetical protein
LLQSLSELATAIGVFVAAWQLWQTKSEARSQFEESLNTHYRDLLGELPLKAMLGRQLSENELQESLRTFYRYFDLSNEQAFLHKSGRVRAATWFNWLEGIQQNMARPAFQQAWGAIVPDIDGSFDELRAIVQATTPHPQVIDGPA